MRDCSSSHSLMNPLPGGSATAPSAAIANSPAVYGIRARSPPSRSRSRSPVARSTDPAAQNNRALNAAWLTTCSRAAASARAANGRLP